MDGPSLEEADLSQISTKNLIVLWASYEEGPVANNSDTFNLDLTTSGHASVFMNGKRIDGTWTASATTPPRLTDENGQEILLTPGNTWFQVVKQNTDISVA
jgi:hypothetical protein